MFDSREPVSNRQARLMVLCVLVIFGVMYLIPWSDWMPRIAKFLHAN